MKSITSLAVLSVFGVFAMAAQGCAAKSSTSGSDLSTDDSTLQANADEVNGADDQASAVLDDTTDGTDGSKSGLADAELNLLGDDAGVGAADAGEVSPNADPAAQADRARANAGIYFKPAGCIQSTVSGNVVTHVFTNCTGPNGVREINGTVEATWTKIANGVQVVRATKGTFTVGGASITRTVTVQFTKDAGIYKKTRTVSMSGTTAGGRAFSRDASWELSFDASSRCWARSGESNSDIGENANGVKKSFTTKVTGVKVCGLLLKCPEAGGSIEVSGTKSKDDKTKTRSLKVEFLGGDQERITATDAAGATKVVERAMVCRG